MTSEERIKFVREAINRDPAWDGEYEVTDETVRKIVDRWEEDVTQESIETMFRGKVE